MGKKVCNSKKRQTKTSNQVRLPLHSMKNHLSPTSKSSETAIFFEDNDDPSPPHTQVTHSSPHVSPHRKNKIQSSSQVEQLSDPSKNQNLRKTEAIFMLSNSEYPSQFKYRQSEVEQVSRFVWQCQQGTKRGCRFLMVAGSPGLGKTLVVSSVLRGTDCKVISLNANLTKCLRQVQEEISFQLLGKRNHKIKTLQIIRQLREIQFTQTVFVYIQEIQTILSGFVDDYSLQFLSLFSHPNLKLSLVGVSNSLDALQKYGAKVHHSLHQVRTLVFKPYGKETIASLVLDKLAELKNHRVNVELRMLPFVANKLETLTKGDLRMVLQFVKQLISSVLESCEVSRQLQLVDDKQVVFQIPIRAVQQIFRKIQNSKESLIRSLPFSQQLLLLGAATIIKNEQLLFVQQKRLLDGMRQACKHIGIFCTNHKLRSWMQELASYCLLGIDLKRDRREPRITLLVSIDQIASSLQQNQKYLCYFLPKK